MRQRATRRRAPAARDTSSSPSSSDSGHRVGISVSDRRRGLRGGLMKRDVVGESDSSFVSSAAVGVAFGRWRATDARTDSGRIGVDQYLYLCILKFHIFTRGGQRVRASDRKDDRLHGRREGWRQAGSVLTGSTLGLTDQPAVFRHGSRAHSPFSRRDAARQQPGVFRGCAAGTRVRRTWRGRRRVMRAHFR